MLTYYKPLFSGTTVKTDVPICLSYNNIFIHFTSASEKETLLRYE